LDLCGPGGAGALALGEVCPNLYPVRPGLDALDGSAGGPGHDGGELFQTDCQRVARLSVSLKQCQLWAVVCVFGGDVLMYGYCHPCNVKQAEKRDSHDIIIQFFHFLKYTLLMNFSDNGLFSLETGFVRL
jgi:hypothetical protein